MHKAHTDEWETPPLVMEQLEREFGRFDLDPCATKDNKKARNFYSKENDGLKHEWFGKVFCNSPHDLIAAFIDKAIEELFFNHVKLVVMLLPVKTTKQWYHHLWNDPHTEFRWFHKRISYINNGNEQTRPHFESMLVIIRRNNYAESH